MKTSISWFVHSCVARALVLCIFALRAATADTVRTGDNVAICGDSITEQKIYSVFIEDYLLMCEPVTNLKAHQFGWSGEAVPGFLKRIEPEVLPFQPSVASTLYGMNDGGYNATNPKTVATFREGTEAMVRKLQAGGVRLVLVGSPGAVDTEKFKTWRLAKCSPEAYNQTLVDLGEAARQAAEQAGAVFVDVHGAMVSAMVKAKAKYGQEYLIADDGVHPTPNGQRPHRCRDARRQ